MNDIFVMSRVLDSIRSPADWSRSSGYAIANCVLGVTKELVDNGLDACEEAGISPKIEVTVDERGISVADNGPGLSQATVDRLADLATRQSARAYRIGPTRGQQGNGLQTTLVLPFVIDGQRGRAEIVSRGQRHEMELTLDRLAEQPKFTVKTTELVQSGTLVRLYLPAERYISDDSKKADFVQLANNFAWLNPHLHLVVTCFGERHEFPAVDPDWKKWTADGNGPPAWYSRDDFARLTVETMRHDPTRRITDYIAEFAGLRRPPVRAEVLEATGLARQSMSALVNGHVGCLHSALLEHGKAVQPDKLGIIGRARLKARMESDCDISTFRYESVADIDEDGLPYLVEMALAEWNGEPRIIRGVNWSAMIGDPFPKLRETNLYLYEYGVTWLVHYVKPAAASMDRGKTSVSVSNKVEAVMDCTLAKVAERWVRKQNAAIARRVADYRAADREEKQERIESKREETRSLKELLFDVIPVERDKYYEKIGEEIDNRQFYYNCRNAAKSIDPSKDFSQQVFDQNRKDWEEANGPIEGLCKKARGVFVEPHSGRRLPLSTRDVRDYIIPGYEYDKIVIWEKQGFEPLVVRHQLAQKLDIGMIFNEGLSVDACRAFAGECHRKGIKLFVMHDCDPAGYVIFDTMQREVDCVDISWTVDECLAAGKVPESDYRRCAKRDEDELHGLPECIIQYLSPAALELFLGEKVCNEGPDGKPIKKCKRKTPYLWQYGRIELNDMFTDPDWAMGEIEKRLTAHGAGKKLLPPTLVLLDTAEEVLRDKLRETVTDRVVEAVDIHGMVDKALAKLTLPSIGDIPAAIQKWATKLKPESWHQAEADMIYRKIDAIRDRIGEIVEEVVV